MKQPPEGTAMRSCGTGVLLALMLSGAMSFGPGASLAETPGASLAAAAAFNSDWCGLGGDYSGSGYARGKLEGNHFSERQWSARLDAGIKPEDVVVSGNRAIVRCRGKQDGRGFGGHFLKAFDLASGEEKWAQDEQKVMLVTPVVAADGKVFAAGTVDQKSLICAWDASSGKLLWSKPYQSTFGLVLRPCKPGLLAGSDASLNVYEFGSGKERWKKPPALHMEASAIAISEDLMYGNDVFGNRICIELKSGTIKWNEKPPAGSRDSRLYGHVFFDGGNALQLIESDAFLVDFRKAEVKAWVPRGSTCRPAFSGSSIYCINRGLLQRLDAKTLKNGGVTLPPEKLLFQPVATDDYVIASSAQTTYVFRASDLELVQELPRGGVPMLANGKLLVLQIDAIEGASGPKAVELHCFGIEAGAFPQLSKPSPRAATPLAPGDPGRPCMGSWNTGEPARRNNAYAPGAMGERVFKKSWAIELPHSSSPGSESGGFQEFMSVYGSMFFMNLRKGTPSDMGRMESPEFLQAFDVETGEKLWEFPEAAMWSAGGVICVDGLAFVVGRARLWCLNAATGRPIWNFSIGTYDPLRFRIADGKGWLITGRTVFCVELKSGDVEKSYSFEQNEYFGDCPIINGRLVGCFNGQLKAWDIKAGKIAWQVPVSGFERTSYAQATVAGDDLFIHTHEILRGYSGKDGKLVFEQSVKGIYGKPIVTANSVIVRLTRGVCAWDRNTQKPLESFNTNMAKAIAASQLSPSGSYFAVDDHVLVSTTDGRIRAFDMEGKLNSLAEGSGYALLASGSLFTLMSNRDGQEQAMLVRYVLSPAPPPLDVKPQDVEIKAIGGSNTAEARLLTAEQKAAGLKAVVLEFSRFCMCCDYSPHGFSGAFDSRYLPQVVKDPDGRVLFKVPLAFDFQGRPSAPCTVKFCLTDGERMSASATCTMSIQLGEDPCALNFFLGTTTDTPARINLNVANQSGMKWTIANDQKFCTTSVSNDGVLTLTPKGVGAGFALLYTAERAGKIAKGQISIRIVEPKSANLLVEAAFKATAGKALSQKLEPKKVNHFESFEYWFVIVGEAPAGLIIQTSADGSQLTWNAPLKGSYTLRLMVGAYSLNTMDDPKYINWAYQEVTLKIE